MLEQAAGSGGGGGEGDADGDADGGKSAHFVTFGDDGSVGDRPDWVPEQLWSDETGLDVQKALKSYSDLRTEFNAKVAKAASMDKGKAVKTADEFLADFKMPDLEDGQSLDRVGDLSPGDPAVKAWADVVARHGVSKERGMAMLRDYLAGVNEYLPEPINMAEEWGRLGGEKRGKAMAAAVVADLRAMSGNDDANALNEQELASMLQFGNNATRISALSKLMATVRGEGSGIPSGGVTLDGAPTTAEVHAMQGKVVESGPNAGRLQYEVDPVYREKVDKAWELAAGKGQTRTSSRLPAGAGNA